MYLEKINGPEDIKKLKIEELLAENGMSVENIVNVIKNYMN